MKKLHIFLFFLLAACVSTEGLSPESSRQPAGNPNSSIVVIEYGDLQCPACKGAHTTIVKPLLEKYGNVIRYEFRHFPLRQIHAFAQEAGEAAECAADQGKFWEFLDDNYEHQDKLSRKDMVERAESVGVTDLDLLKRCMKSRIKRDAVQKEYEEGLARGVNATPTFLVGDAKVERNTLDAISAAIEERLSAQKL